MSTDNRQTKLNADKNAWGETSLVLLGRSSSAANEQRNQSYGDQTEAYQGPIEQPTTCNGEEGERAGDADGEQIQAQGNQLSHDGEPIHCGEEHDANQ